MKGFELLEKGSPAARSSAGEAPVVATARIPPRIRSSSALLAIAARLLALALFCAALASEGAEEQPAWNVLVELRIVAVPIAQANRLLPDLRRPGTFAEAERRVLALVAGSEAELVEQLQGVGISGTKFTAESLGDMRYRSELDLGGRLFEPRHSPYATEILSRKLPPPLALKQERARRRSDELQKLFQQGFSMNLTTPTAFDTRNIGASLEAEPQYDAVKREIGLDVVAQWVAFDGLQARLPGEAGAPTFDPPQPRYFSCKFETGFTLASGQGTLLGTLVRQQPRPRMSLFLLHATAQPIPLRP